MRFPDREALWERVGSRGQLECGQAQGVGAGCLQGQRVSRKGGIPASRNIPQPPPRGQPGPGLWQPGRELGWGDSKAGMKRAPRWAADRTGGSPFWSPSQRVPALGSWPSGPPPGVGPALGAAPGAGQQQSSSVDRSRFWGHTGVAGGSGLADACPQPHSSSHLTSSRNLSNSK